VRREERIGSVSDVPDGGARQVVVDGHKIAVVRIDDDFYAIGDTCTHQNISLSEGEVHTDTREIECWKHGSTFSLVTGAPDSLPATRPVPVFTIRRDGDDLFVEVPE
jgi:3-phenylpropionate/trans-cinnamate dioxygenase ferredoxin subunit